ncbi:50S ribosomal protein L24 [Candidatus Woesebacteria bacterium RIFCSPHIGHO2_02_FULL_42_20]|uniref:Large ribosomal subunit protein uL24 n=1 Tax=Candidatus Woesebacteria bacterium RIFCSPHIGHO2_12_FULL_41_24 TaxID=1802510 RepID=A0A1F8API1_9BACT|nr:MAG: 50S ribosomal protein L24 [Candidatus Woesebacteria bacterium RBG_16_41_13]OGM29246.1 MAG: 50S ribosomal protein L24 [Candidatus Woesebacteria bacterium RIFCSPHIGHO2_01_FULL_42_80]OGM34744.1 MAG: 50S ribosomal protein L24 [Candidatus Woesebacteria bacterium RIFCSPHIGHO2_02_FULL_42_20]OGM53667.1 MAG: 50S ribosomal protein L24 [Candidatus Woesebacteria bacterium RIFCSPHIGHO2_12_FULL_41_24]OGM67043.1 MAG: 50S ribosomal protein L24 [Candidatus Woesebacteria bacterium RIFCSPLOWO2_01_FULL_42_
MLKIKKGDTVKVVAGKDKGKDGVVERVFADKFDLLVPNLNLYKKHVKAAVAPDKKGGIYEIPKPLSIANVALVCPHCKKIARVGFKVLATGEKQRFCKKCNRAIDTKSKKDKGG